MIFVSQGTLKNLRVKLFSKMERLPIKYFDTHAHGDIMSVYTNDIDTMRQMISQSMPQLISSVITIVSIVVSMVMLNVPLLYWAAQVTGSDHYREIAAAHTATTLANSFRPDGSTYHTFFMNPDGTPKGGRTCQGYKDDSFWARGQAWGVYGSAIGYTYTHDEKFLEVFRKALAFYLSRLPEDMIPCWDMLFAPESGEPRDSSSAAIVACGLLEAAKYVDETEAAQWRTLARQMLASLATNYAVKPGTLGSGQLLHGTYSKKSPYNTCTPEGVDECTSWGDYFYMEALTRLTKDWEMYW